VSFSFSTAVIINLTFGHKISGEDDTYLQLALDSCYKAVPAARPEGGALVEIFPFSA
jgi:hypothetical protein